MIRQSFCIPMFASADCDLDRLLGHAAAVGYAGTEIWGRDARFEQIIQACRRHGLALVSMVGHESWQKGLNDPREHDRIESEIRTSLELARRHGIPNLICFSGKRIDGHGEAQAIDACVQGLRRLAPLAEAAGLTLNLELLNSRIDHAGYQADRTAWGAHVCQRVNSPRVKLLYDIYHMQIMEGNIIHTLRNHIAWIGHVHTAGVPGRADLDEQQELNYPAICRALLKLGYDGFVGHEFQPRGDARKALAEAFAVCDVSPD